MKQSPNTEAAMRAAIIVWSVAQNGPVSTAERFCVTHRDWIAAVAARLKHGEALTPSMVVALKPGAPVRAPQVPRAPSAPPTPRRPSIEPVTATPVGRIR